MTFDLVFEGGGAKGMVFVGAMEAFEAAGHQYDRLLGTSAGAITATLLAAGYTTAEMLAAMDERENDKPVFVGFMGVPGPFQRDYIRASATADFLRRVDIPFVPDFLEDKIDEKIIDAMLKIVQYRHVFSFVEQGGWFAAHRFEKWMQDKLNAGRFTNSPRRFGKMTLAEFFQATGSELSLVASDTTAQQILVLNHRTAPDCPIVSAVRMSMSIPLLWQEVEWQAAWGRYQDKDLVGHMIVDGGMLSNFPIELFVSSQPHITAVMGQKQSEQIIGLMIDESLPVEGAPAIETAGGGIEWGKLRTVQRIQRLIDTMTSAHDKQVIEAFESLVVRLPAHGYGTTEFDMSEERRSALVRAGKKAMEHHLATRSDAQPPDFNELEPAGASAAQDGQATADRIASRILK
jgi:predicted acylesterase/phospholipase RssA